MEETTLPDLSNQSTQGPTSGTRVETSNRTYVSYGRSSSSCSRSRFIRLAFLAGEGGGVVKGQNGQTGEQKRASRVDAPWLAKRCM